MAACKKPVAAAEGRIADDRRQDKQPTGSTRPQTAAEFERIKSQTPRDLTDAEKRKKLWDEDPNYRVWLSQNQPKEYRTRLIG
eukprot:NODE_1149_length_661_cov_148.341503_g900_i0.p1 GENE.NODE_1149_length_661_cov_148.341503_g900_i0~~NODE_1149_length_661_cov_148.341503_g900_i0.p1  ORF type:complete len:83 (+),score=9.90 NODE_1149_length_661_cov_148.341503_g900_i0:345-593(+)